MQWLLIIALLVLIAIASTLIYKRLTRRHRLGNDDTHDQYASRLTARINPFHKDKRQLGRSGRREPFLRPHASYSGWEGPALTSLRPMVHATRWRARLGVWQAVLHLALGGLLILAASGGLFFGLYPHAWQTNALPKISEMELPWPAKPGPPGPSVGPKTDGAERFQDWYKTCVHSQSSCRIYTASQPSSGLYRYKLLELTEEGQVLFTALTTERDHYDRFTNTVSVYVTLDRTNYVRSVRFFAEEQATMYIDGKKITDLMVRQDSQLRAPDDDFVRIVEGLANGSQAIIQYVSPVDSSTESIFSAAGFSEAFQSMDIKSAR